MKAYIQHYHHLRYVSRFKKTYFENDSSEKILGVAIVSNLIDIHENNICNDVIRKILMLAKNLFIYFQSTYNGVYNYKVSRP